MMSWEEWSTTGGDKDGAFPCLRELSIVKCPKLDVVAIEPIPSLEELRVERCALTMLRSMVGVSSSIARLSIDRIKGLTQLHGDILEHLKAVKYLDIWMCDEVTYLWESESAAYEILVKLQRFVLRGCASLVSLGEKEEHLKIGMESVTEVAIINCRRLKTYNCPKNIEKLEIRSCPSLTSLTFPTVDGNDLLPSTLKKLQITRCENVEVSWLLINNNFLSSLESLAINSILNLWLLPEGCLVHLTKLLIWNCDNIESIPDNGYGFLPFHCLRELEISNCKNLKSFPHEQLQSLTSLEKMVILKCRSLDDFPFPCGLWPPNLGYLKKEGLKKDISEWGMQNFPTSLVTLHLHGDEKSRVVSFGAKEGKEDISSFLLPSSLTSLSIWNFKELESLSEVLTCLQDLDIRSCPKLRDLPETVLPSLSSFTVSESCWKLRKKCRRRKGKYWPLISQIPHFTNY